MHGGETTDVVVRPSEHRTVSHDPTTGPGSPASSRGCLGSVQWRGWFDGQPREWLRWLMGETCHHGAVTCHDLDHGTLGKLVVIVET